MKLLFIISFICYCAYASGQQDESDVDDNTATQLEDLSQEDDAESENDYDLQQLDRLKKHPLDINGTDLLMLPMLDQLLIDNLATYRRLLGDIIDIHELQAVPGFTIAVIKQIMPFITVRSDASAAELSDRLTQGEHSFLLRSVFTPQIAAGFRSDSGSSKKFEGSRLPFLFRYKYQFRNLMQYGVVAEKDAGEKLFPNKPFTDFISFHLFARNVGLFKCIALGDYTINFGQGLIHWQSQAFKKSGSVLNIKRQSETLRPYHSAGEYNFHRGAAVTVALRKWQATLFASYRNISANTEEDSSSNKFITSIITSGLNRTSTERANRNSATLMAAGANIKRIVDAGHVGINIVRLSYTLPMLKDDKSYNLYALRGKEFINASVDYAYTFRNLHLFGEAAVNRNFSRAVIQGMMTSLSASVDLALLYRDLQKSYTSVYGNAFTEATVPGNERGLYTGLSLRPSGKWRLDLYADIFAFPWLRYRLDARSAGAAYLIQLTCKPNKQTEMYTRFRYRIKPLNIDESEDEAVPGQELYANWRSHVSVQVTRAILIRSRVELCKYDHLFAEFPSTGYLFYADFVYKPFGSWWSGNVRFQAFEAENYNTRLYAYENDLLYVSSTPSFYNNGIRYYFNFMAKLRPKRFNNKVLTISLKAATTVYTNISAIGSGVSGIPGNRNSSLKVQFFLTE